MPPRHRRPAAAHHPGHSPQPQPPGGAAVDAAVAGATTAEAATTANPGHPNRKPRPPGANPTMRAQIQPPQGRIERGRPGAGHRRRGRSTAQPRRVRPPGSCVTRRPRESRRRKARSDQQLQESRATGRHCDAATRQTATAVRPTTAEDARRARIA
jgi:hypothetical protein